MVIEGCYLVTDKVNMKRKQAELSPEEQATKQLPSVASASAPESRFLP